METQHWGRPLWVALFDIAAGYTVNKNPDKKEQYKRFFESLGDVLPCSYCRKTYRPFLDLLNFDKYVEEEEGLIHLVYDMKCLVNEKLARQAQSRFLEERERILDSGLTRKEKDAAITREAAKLPVRRTPPREQVIRDVLRHRVVNP